MNTDNKNPADDNGVTPLHLAAENGHSKVCHHIMMNIDNKNPSDNKRQTPLYVAAQKGHYHVVKAILENIEDKNPVDLNRNIVLQENTTNEDPIIDLILNNVVDPNETMDWQYTPRIQ